MQVPYQKRIWQMLSDKDRALLEAILRYGVSRRTVAALMGISKPTVTHRFVRLLRLLRDERLVAAVQQSTGQDLYLLKLYYFHRMSAIEIAARSGLAGDHGGHEADAIRRRIKRILRDAA